MIQKVWRLLNTLSALGCQRALATIHHRGAQAIKKQFVLPLVATQWHELYPEFKYIPIPMPTLLLQQIDTTQLYARADQYAQNCFAPVGAPLQCFTEIPWHDDIRLSMQNSHADYRFDAQVYYKNIVIKVKQDADLGKDIKVPWELARFQFLPTLGLAYHLNGHERYAHAARNQIISWLDANPISYGIHWFNGMEVAIRAVNWIIALQWLQKSWQQDTSFYTRLICSLYDHMRYLEHNWEWYDGRTNNHYLANLVGYAYLCWFFKTMPGMSKKWQWCNKQLRGEFAWQIFDEGTSYEGSTRYHCLVTELFLHGFYVAMQMGETVDIPIRNKLKRMVVFIEQCKPITYKEPIAIGDDDHGSLLERDIFKMNYWYAPFAINQIKHASTCYYKQFGISISHQHNWQVSLRHHAYSKRQPTGHFHQDAGSITLAYNGVPIMVDPGTYVYTASAYWRNYFRSAVVHNTVYTSEPLSADMFSLPLVPSTTHDRYMQTTIILPGGKIQRTLIIEKHHLLIRDVCSFAQPQHIAWNFTLTPDVKLEGQNNIWSMTIGTIRIAYSSLLSLFPGDAWICPQYGSLEKTICLKASKEVMYDIIEHRFTINRY